MCVMAVSVFVSGVEDESGISDLKLGSPSLPQVSCPALTFADAKGDEISDCPDSD